MPVTRRQALVFLLLCFWSSVGWLTVDFLPARLSPSTGQGLHFLLVGVIALIFQIAQHGWRSMEPLRQGKAWMLAGVGLLGAPLLLLDRAETLGLSVPGVVVFALVPVIVVVAVGRMSLLIPALAGVAGVLVLVPSRLPSSIPGWEGLGLTFLAAGLTSGCLILLPRLLTGVGVGTAVASICLTNGVLLNAAGLVLGSGGWSWSALGVEAARGLLLGAPEVVLLLWLIKATAPHRVATRYLVAPLFTVIEGFVLLKPGLDVRTTVGVALLAGGSWWLLRSEPQESPRLGLL